MPDPKYISRIVIALLLAIGLNATPAISMLRAEETPHVPMQLAQLNQTPRKNPFLEGGQMVRPSSREREAVYQMLALKPRPKTLKDADMRFLQGLRDKASWFVLDQRMVHEIWSEVHGREWDDAR
ncbi:MAG: hypothetical protein L0H94_04745 [Nitrospira sp.]|nr:hypothetical protein [Nitrospira sp.]